MDEDGPNSFLKWCHAERVKAIERLEFFTKDGGKVVIEHAEGRREDVTDQIVEECRRVIVEMTRAISGQTGLGA